MSALKLFVSHSSRLDDVDQEQLADDHNWKLLQSTCEQIKQHYGDNIEILVDQNQTGLYPGSDWELRLSEWMAECHVAIILVSQRALNTSLWVQKEATILSWRKALEKDFTLIPVLIPGQSEANDLAKDIWSILHIDKNQCIHDAQTAEEIVNRLESTLGEPDALKIIRAITPFERLERLVGHLLQQGTTADNLSEIWGQLLGSKEKPAWLPDEKERFAGGLARYLLRDTQACLKNFSTLLDKISPNPDEARANELLKAVRALWIDTRVAGKILSSDHHSNMMALNGWMITEHCDLLNTQHYTLDRYLERAWPETDLRTVIPITDYSSSEFITNAIRDKCIPSPSIPANIKNNLINELTHPLLVFFRCTQEDGGLPSPDILQELEAVRALYPKLIFLFWTGNELPEPMNSQFTPLTPPIENEMTEARQYMDECTAKTLLNTKYGN